VRDRPQVRGGHEHRALGDRQGVHGLGLPLHLSLAMADTDWAIVAGISHYPYLEKAEVPGAAGDAKRFKQWLMSPEGGGVPERNIELITPPETPTAEPTEVMIDKAFVKTYKRGRENGGSAGRRLYVYLAGHGIAQDIYEASVLTANVEKGLFGYHIP